jgi:hypothetical protein
MIKWLFIIESASAELSYPFPWWSCLMLAFLLTLGVLYLVKAAWPKLLSSGAAPMDWEWPVRLVVQGWGKLFGADSVFDKKDDK